MCIRFSQSKLLESSLFSAPDHLKPTLCLLDDLLHSVYQRDAMYQQTKHYHVRNPVI